MSPQKLNEGFNALLAKHGIKVGTEIKVGNYAVVLGSTYDDVTLDFDVTIPVAYAAVAEKVKDMFIAAGLHTFAATWEHLGDGGKDLLHVNGIV